VVESSAIRFATNKEILPEDAEEVVMRSIERLLERDNPQLETIKMQVYYDGQYALEHKSAQKALSGRNKLISSHLYGILEIGAESAGDFEVLTKLFRRIFRYLLDFPPNPKAGVKTIEKEVAAALESVFPRVGLKTFVQLATDEKRAQLAELGRIVLGIRLLNRSQGKGGGGLEDLDEESKALADSLYAAVEADIAVLLEECNRYHTAVIRSYLLSAKEEAGPEKKARQDIAERWSHELANKRQLCSLLTSLLGEIDAKKRTVQEITTMLVREKDGVHALVYGRAAVPKEEVYPRFDTMGELWVRLYEAILLLRAQRGVYEGLGRFNNSFISTLPSSADPLTAVLSEEEISSAMLAMEDEPPQDHAQSLSATSSAEPELQEENVTRTSEAILLSIDTAEDFLALPLELQGYCPWTIVHSKGLLVPGKPAIGVIQYRGGYYVCDQEAGVRAFMKNPELYLESIRALALASPEYIHLLRVQRWFPQAAISRLMATEHLMEGANDHPGLGGSTRDMGTETPLHFEEGHIDINYHWNEWELRRRALKLINLQKCATTAQQTDESHFRRSNETMLYIQRHNGTQTKRDKATNPPLKTTFVAGLRGKIITETVSKYISGEGLEGEEAKKPRVVTLTLDL
jgi:hypothetical protein